MSDSPDLLLASGWQGTDEEHPPGEGVPAYRVVYKALKTFLPEVNMGWPNLIMRAGHGSVARGGIKLPDVLPRGVKATGFCPSPERRSSRARR